MRNIFAGDSKSKPLKIDSFFIELSLVLPVFAICSCVVLQMLGAAANRSEQEKTYSAAVACCESWCELYSATGDIDRSAEELFGKDAAEKSREGSGYSINADSNCRFKDGSETVSITITEKVSECVRDNFVYGRLYSSDITVTWEDGTLTEEAVYYRPFPAVITLEESGE